MNNGKKIDGNMNKKPHQRLLDGMPPHIAEKVDKMVGNMKEVYDLAMESWEGCDGCTEDDKHFFINGFMRGYNRAMGDNQPRLMNGDGSEIRKVQSKHVELLDEISLEEVPEEQLEQERNPNYKYFDIDSISIEEIEEEAKFRSQIESVQYADGFFDGIEWFIDKLKEKQ
jgi:glutaredoxin